MKLCAGILYWGLKEELKTVELHGAGSQELTLSRPEFYLDRTKTFERNRVYVCSADHLPARPSLSANVCLVCLGQHWNLNGFYDRCSVIVVEADTDIFRVFNLVQHIFDRYEAWEERLWHILRHGASLPQELCKEDRKRAVKILKRTEGLKHRQAAEVFLLIEYVDRQRPNALQLQQKRIMHMSGKVVQR